MYRCVNGVRTQSFARCGDANERNRGAPRRRDLATSLRGLPKQMLHFPMESQPHTIVDSFATSWLGFPPFAMLISENFDSVRQTNASFFILATALADFAQDDTLNVIRCGFYTRTDQTPRERGARPYRVRCEQRQLSDCIVWSFRGWKPLRGCPKTCGSYCVI